ncbi:MAG TPA: UvrD-helicase domain-containing protein [Thermoanaerobaculia bacterium]|nr:UvrD-helicase domain-containing protein [Thermoanaerobaculia bacterium]
MMMKGTLADSEARSAIGEHLDVTMIVEAAAGTGKTTSLVQRLIGLVRSGRAGVETIAAITFTIKSAAHLREKFQESLERSLEQSEGEERTRIALAITNIERCFIGTTHAFCARLLRERPVEAAVDPDFKELDDIDAQFLGNRFFEEWIARASALGDHRMAALRKVGISPSDLKAAFRQQNGFPDVVPVYEETSAPDLDHALESLFEFLDDCQPNLPTDATRKEPDKFEEMVVDLIQRRRTQDLRDPVSKAVFLEHGLHPTRKPTQNRWPDKKIAKDLGVRYAALATGTIAPTVTRWKEHVHGIIMAFLVPAVREYARERRRNGTLSFEDLLICARDLLKLHPNVRRYFQRRFTHLLVDEFQDTDPLQAEVMFYLTGADVDETRWRNLVPRPGSLFIVGDPKQSIYRFRRADITIYLEVKQQIESHGGEVVQLSTNFRSLPAICDFVNENFSRMFVGADVEEGKQAAHVELVPYRQGESISGAFVLATSGNTRDEVATAEATWIVEWVRSAVESGLAIDDDERPRPIQWGDILLVSNERKRLSIYARALDAAAIPYEVTGGKAFADSEEMHNILPALKCLVDPEDGVALAAFLRGPICGVDDQALYEFARAGGRFSLFRPMPEGIDPRIIKPFELLRTSVSESHQLPPAATLARLFDRLGVISLAASDERGGTRSGNLLLALAFARRISSRGESLSEVVAEIEHLLEESSDVEEMDVDPKRENSVRLMNLHQVKGLEAPVVFLIDPIKPFIHQVDVIIDRTADESLGYFAIPPAKKGKTTMAIPKGWDSLQLREQSFKNAERMRLLYVAATRARSVLVTGVQPRSSGKLEGFWKEFAVQPTATLPSLNRAPSGERSVADIRYEFEKARVEIDASLDAARTASYSVLPITKLSHKTPADLVKHEEGLGRGTSWGRVMHRLLEAMLRTPHVSVRLYAENLLKDEERDAAELQDVMDAVTAIESSNLWQRARRSPECLVEVPFALQVDAKSLGLDEPGDTLLHGTIDLVFREGSQWIVVDYKSDIIGNRFDHLVSYYRAQVEHYATFWSQLTGAPSKPGLFFIDGAREVWL